jgi:hypothetical protein
MQRWNSGRRTRRLLAAATGGDQLKYVRALGMMLFLLHVPAAREGRGQEAANCRGVVVDENAVPVAAARVGFTRGGEPARQVQTDSAGRFVLRNLAPAEYQAEIRKEAFFVLSGQTVTLQPGENEVTFSLNHVQELHEQVQVVTPANQIDTQDTSERYTLTAQQIRDIPVPSTHTLQQSLIAMPEVVQDNLANLHVAGARSGDIQYLLDGFEIGDPANGTLSARFNVDATRAAEVQTGGIAASYPHSGASVLTLETVNGDDRWRFGTTDPFPGINVQEGAHLGNWYPRFVVSGPIERGRFWFSDSISVQHTFAVIKPQPSGANTTEEWAGDNLLRLQYNITPQHLLHGSFLYNAASDTNLGLDALDPQSTTLDARRHRSFVSLKDQVWLDGTLLEVGGAFDGRVIDFVPQGTAPYVLLVNGSSGNFFESVKQTGRRVQAFANAIAGSRHWHGTHQLAAGANVSGLRYSQSAKRGEIHALDAKGILVRQTTFSGAATPEVSNTQAGGYAQDGWQIKRFVIQAGIRTDWDRFTQSLMAEPRISGNFLPFKDDRAKFSLGWGIYNAPLNLSLISQSYDQRQIDTFYSSMGTVPVFPSAVSQFALPLGGLEQPRFTISNAGWRGKIKSNTLIGVGLLARNGYHQFAYIDQQPAQPGGLFLLQDRRKDRYRSATVSVRHIFSESMQVYAAYTRSSAHTNEVLNSALGSIFYAAQQPGPLAWDAPNRLLTWGWAPTHIWGLQLSYFLEYRSGYPYSVVNLQQEIVGAPNSSRFPDYVSLNLGLEKKFGFWGYLWAARLEAVNILGRENPDTVVNNIAAPNFAAFSGGQGRAFTGRLRFVGKK